MTGKINSFIGPILLTSAACCGWRWFQPAAGANPTGGTVASGTATFHTSGSHETITTSAQTYINWSSFNIGAGETTTFVQPSSSSVVWNNINNANPAQILGTLNANGYVVLQSQAGFYIGGQAVLNTHGLTMTTAGGPPPNLNSGGAWEFDAPPPAAKIVNYGQINIVGGGPAYLIASDIENDGTISAPNGQIGLYAGQKVLISMSPSGLGLSAQVTLPQGSVDNNGRLIADAGRIAAQAQFVNQNGLVQADSVQNVNGSIELIASDSVNLGANSAISAKGGATGASSGGSVTIKSANSFADQAGSGIDISGGAQGGNGGQVEISAPQMSTIHSTINGQAASGFVSGELAIDPLNIVLASFSSDPNAQYSGTVNANDPPVAGTLTLNVNDFSPTLSQINLAAINNITLNTVWNLANSAGPATLTLTAGNSIVVNNSDAIIAGNNWNIALSAGSGFVPAGTQLKPPAGSITSPSYGIYLGDSAYLQTQNGNINATALNEVIIADDATSGSDGIRTMGGGSIAVTATDGNVDTGDNLNGYTFNSQPNSSGSPYYTVSSQLGGISTAAGGNVTINAGGNVSSDTAGGSFGSPGTGTFGANSGNLTINAGGSVFGNYVVANGAGSITAGANIGSVNGQFALSLVSGSWKVSAPNGDIYLQEVLNPNGVYNFGSNTKPANRGYKGPTGQNLFNYSPDDSVSLNAQGVIFTGQTLPRLPGDGVQILLPPVLNVTAGSGGVTLNGSLTLFPSVDQSLNITTTDGGSFTGNGAGGTNPELLMSDSSATRWNNPSTFSDTDHSAALPVQAGNPNPSIIDVAGNVENLTLIMSKATATTVGGNLINSAFSGQNLSASDVTSINVAGQIYNQPLYAFVDGTGFSSLPGADLLSGVANSWDAIFALALNPSLIPTPAYLLSHNVTQNNLLPSIISLASLYNTSYAGGKYSSGGDQGFVYNAATGQLGYEGQMPASLLAQLSQPLTILSLVNSLPVVGANGKFETTTVNWVKNPAQLAALYTASLSDVSNPSIVAKGYRIGGPGQFDITAGSISLGNSYGILSCGVADPTGGFNRYGDLASVTPEGAALNVTLSGDLSMLTSTIATLGGGNVTVNSTSGAMDLGSAGLASGGRQVGYGIYSAAGGDVAVTAQGDINIDGSRIGTYDGGDILVESYTGNVEVGSGGNTLAEVFLTYTDPATGLAKSYAESVAGSGVVAYTLVPGTLAQGYPPTSVPTASNPGNIKVTALLGKIDSTVGGITQLALNGTSNPGPYIDLTAGVSIDLGQAGAVGGDINVNAPIFKGSLFGKKISLNTPIFNGTAVGTSISFSGPQTEVSGNLVAPTVNVSASSLSANVVSANANGSSTLGKATASAASQSAAQQASVSNQQFANSTDDSDDQKRKQKTEKPKLQRIKRVTVILPKET